MRPTRSFEDGNDDQHPTLLVALDDVDGWLDDPRKYRYQHHRAAWDSMADDAGKIFDTRGPRLSHETSAIDRLRQQLRAGSLLGPDRKRRLFCRDFVRRARAELARPATAEAAFDDLVEAAANLDTDYTVLDQLVQHLEAAIDASGRRPGAKLLRLDDVLDNRAWDVKLSLYELGDLPDPPNSDEIMNDAGLTLDSRLELCHRLLTSDQPGGRHVVWLCYENARLHPHTVEFGDVTFFNGEMLVDALEQGHMVIGQHHTPVPAELPRPGDLHSWSDWPPKDEDWVAVRVNLGQQPLADPVRDAVDQADSLVKLAAFYGRGTVWRRMPGHQRVLDGQRRGGSMHWGRADIKKLVDKTDFVLEAIAPQFTPHVLITDPTLRSLIDTTAVLDTHRHDIDPTSIVHSIRAVEKVIGHTPAPWHEYLKIHFRGEWARDRIRDEIGEALHRVGEAYELRGVVQLPPDEELYRLDRGQHSYDHAVAITELPRLAQEIPTHHPTARQVRSLAKRTANTGQLQVWAEELTAEYERLIDRLARCRNSLAHGGPISDPMARTVQHLADTHARRTTGSALEAFLHGRPPASALDASRLAAEQWLAALPALGSVEDAFPAS